MQGRVVNPLGQPIDGKGEIPTSDTRLIEEMAPGIIKEDQCMNQCKQVSHLLMQ